MFEGLKKWWAARQPKPKPSIHVISEFEPGSTVTFKINDWTVVYTFSTAAPDVHYTANSELLRTILDPKYKDCWSGDVFAVKVLLKSGEINERNYP